MRKGVGKAPHPSSFLWHHVYVMVERAGRTQTREDFITDVRTFMRDEPGMNALVEGLETGHLMIDLAVDMAVDDFNFTKPIIGTWTFESFPSFELLLYGTVIRVLISAGIQQSRNRLVFTDGGLQIATSDKTELYQSWIQFLRAEYDQLKREWKKFRNLSKCYGGVQSEYLTASAYGGYALGQMSDIATMGMTSVFA